MSRFDSRTIETDADVAEGAEWLAKCEPRFAKALELTGPLPLRRQPDGFDALKQAILGQQISVAAARSIAAKLDAAGFVVREDFANASQEALQTAGLSRQKARYIKGVAESDIDFIALRTASDDEVVSQLTALPGIGVWTAEIYAMFALGRPDVFAPGDLALAESARRLFNLSERPKPKAFRQMAEQWSPWRAVAARLLWSYYRVDLGRDGIT